MRIDAVTIFPDYFDAYAQVTAPVIAIDGPSASGKGTVAARVAGTLERVVVGSVREHFPLEPVFFDRFAWVLTALNLRKQADKCHSPTVRRHAVSAHHTTTCSGCAFVL